jgi:glycine dehydrogenase subunit 2
MFIEEETLFEQTSPGRMGYSLPECDVPEPSALSANICRKAKAELPELSEADVVRHFVRLSTYNYNKDAGFYPLGSCTMKYNPKSADAAAAMEGFSKSHPYQPAETVTGNLQLMKELENYLAEISGLDAVTLQPAAGAHGELTGMLVIRAYHLDKHKNPRKKVIIPDSAHGTNPASVALCGYAAIEIKSDSSGILAPEAVKAIMDEDVAAIMITNPNTLGIFEPHIKEIADIVHAKGGLVYMDGANLNALMGISRPGDFGVDVMHFNLHKTFATPHGGGGPGSGPIAVKKFLEEYLPNGGSRDSSPAKAGHPKSIGRMKAFYGNFSVLLRAYAYIREMGAEGLKRASELAVLNAAYIKARLSKYYNLPYSTDSLHECVFSDKAQNEFGIKTLDIAKRLMDYGMHPPTIYFPLIVHGAIMIEPTETENKAACDQFCEAMIKIAEECKTNPEIVKNAPTKTFRRRLDEVKAVKDPRLKIACAS